MRPLHKFLSCLVALALLGTTPAIAQRSASKARITEPVNDEQLVTLRGNTVPAANARNDRGSVNPQLRMTDLVLVLKRGPEQQAAFDAFVASQYDPTSANFHRWLEPAQIGAQFGPASADIATVSNWLTGHGFSVDEISNDRMTIRFSGNAGLVARAFHTDIHNISVKGEEHIANMSDPQIPMALDPVVAGVKALHNFFPRPLHKAGGTAKFNPETGTWQNTANAAAGAKPSANAFRVQPNLGITVPNGGNPYLVEDVTPYDFAAIYNVLPLWNATTPIDGTGQTIAVAGTSKVRTTDVSTFRSTFGLPAGPAFQTIVANSTDPGICNSTAAPSATNNYCTIDDQTENALDVEWSGAIAKNAQVVLVVSGTNSSTTDTVYASSNYVIQHNTAKILNVSYGLCELGMGTTGNTSYNNLWQSAAAAGIAVFVASGDSGSPACDQGQATGTPYGAQYGLSVSGLASTQYNTAVGGTDLNWGSTASPYWNTSNNSTTGANAAGYMPEVPWNNSCTNPEALAYFASWAKAVRDHSLGNPADPTDAETACNFAVNWFQVIINNGGGTDLSQFVNTIGAGGGKSNCINGDQSTVASCTQGYPKPSWQAGVTGIPNDSARDIPDVSFFASNGFLGSAYLICVTDNGACVNSTSPTSEPVAQEIGGTSASSPAMASVMALINQKAGAPQGNPNAEFYDLAKKQTYSSCKSENGTTSNGCYFNDVVTGTITMACQQGDTDCSVTHSGDTWGVLSGYNATVGFDLATGLGTLNVANVVNAWGTATGATTATVTVTATPTTITTSQSTNVTVTVAGSSGTPTGTVVINSGSFASATKTLTAGTATFAIPGTSLAAGTVTLIANYSGDGTYASGTGSTTVNTSTFSLAASTPANVNRGSSATSTVTVNTSNSYVGTVALSCVLTSGPTNSAADAPACAASAGTVAPGATGTATVTTKAATTAALERPMAPGKGRGLLDGAAVLALVLMIGIPAKRKSWRAMLGMLVLVIALGGLAACGGGGGSGGGGGGGGGGSSDPGTATGQYTFTVTGTGNPAQTTGNTTTFTVNVN